MRIHKLNTLKAYFQATKTGLKMFEIRKSNKGFSLGDVVVLQEWCDEKKEYTGNEIELTISYIFEGGKYGLSDEYCILGLKEK